MIFLFILTFLYWITAALDVKINGQLELERKYWNMYDPTLIAEGIYCLATIMAFLKLLYICQLDYHLGPLQLSLVKMIKDVLKFIILFTIIILAFSAGNIWNLLWYFFVCWYKAFYLSYQYFSFIYNCNMSKFLTL